jgi:UPF0716 family protein affecting phage T7 exclusion
MAAHAQVFLIGIALGGVALHYLVAPIGVWLALLVLFASALSGAAASFSSGAGPLKPVKPAISPAVP